MNTYILTYTPFPNNGGASANRIKGYAKSIISTGTSCIVVPYKHTETHDNPINLRAEGSYEGVPFVYSCNDTIRSKFRIIRYLQDKFDKILLIRFIKKHIKKNDIVILYLLEETTFVSKIIDSIHSVGAYAILELCEYPFLECIGGLGDKLREKYAKTVLSKVDGCICISRALYDYAKPLVNDKCITTIVPILVDFEKYNLPNNSETAEYEYVFHSGSLYERKDGVVGIIAAIGIANQELERPIHFVSTGILDRSPDRNKIIDVIDKYNLHDCVHFLGYVSTEVLQEKLSKAKLVIINKHVTTQNEYCFATKTGEYAASGKPIIMTDIGEAKRWFKHKESAFFVECENVIELSEAIIRLMQDDKLRNKISDGGKDVCIKKFSIQANSHMLLHMFQQIIELNEK